MLTGRVLNQILIPFIQFTKMKLLIVILLFSYTANAQHYYVIPTMNNPEAKAINISKKFYQLSRPNKGSDVTEMLLSYIKHPLNDSIAIVIDSTFDLPKGTIIATHVTNWINETYPTLTTTQRNTLTNYINSNNKLRLGRLLIAARIKLWKKTEMEARGWFNYPAINLGQ